MIRKIDISKPPKTFEEFNEVSGISGRYIYPQNLNAYEYERYLLSLHADIWDYYKCVEDMLYLAKPFPAQKLGNLRALKDELIALNPILSSIPCNEDSPQELFDILFGAASCINADDISFFLDKRKEKAPNLHAALRDDEYLHLFNSISTHPCLKVRINWVPSKQTLRHINQQMQLKGPKT